MLPMLRSAALAALTPTACALPFAAAAAGVTGARCLSAAAAAAPYFMSTVSEPRILVTGACGQIGTELVDFLRGRVGINNVVATDVRSTPGLLMSGPFHYLDVTQKDQVTRLVVESGITHIVHLASLLSAVGERNPQLALHINMTSIQDILEIAMKHNVKVFSPSSIAVYGPTTPRVATPDSTVMQPRTVYGITKVHQELLGQYYADRFGVDYRSLRFPGIVSSKALPGGGTTDYAVDIFHHALQQGQYTCFLSPEAALPMLYMPDTLEAVWQLMCAPKEALTQTTYNVTAMSFTPQQLAHAIQKHLPHFKIGYQPDFRDAIARSWPASIDDSAARRDWGWRPQYLLEDMTQDMLAALSGSTKGVEAVHEPKAVAAA